MKYHYALVGEIIDRHNETKKGEHTYKLIIYGVFTTEQKAITRALKYRLEAKHNSNNRTVLINRASELEVPLPEIFHVWTLTDNGRIKMLSEQNF